MDILKDVKPRNIGLNNITETLLIQHAKDELNESIKETNTFFVTKWTEYKSKINTLSISPFKEIKTFITN